MRIHPTAYRPRISFISVQKRHQTRLFPSPNDPNSGDPKTGNVRPGLCVDSKVGAASN